MTGLRVLMVAEGSGGHLIPALQVARVLSQRGARVTVWYAVRPQVAELSAMLRQEVESAAVEVAPIPSPHGGHLVLRAWRCGALLSRSQRRFKTLTPDVVVGFGGLVSAPVLLAARFARIRTLLHEQNVVMGKANRYLSRCVDRVAVSFEATQRSLNGTPSIITGMPVQSTIGQVSRADAAARLGLDADRPTLLILGGSQGSRAINRFMIQVAERYTAEERVRWQFLHLAGGVETPLVEAAYARQRLTAVVQSFLADMASAYAAADLVIGRAGASTIAELAQSQRPSILIPYRYAGGHQRANARLVEAVGGGIVLDEDETSPEQVLSVIRRLMADAPLRTTMGEQVSRLAAPEATDRLARIILDLGTAGSR